LRGAVARRLLELDPDEALALVVALRTRPSAQA